MATTWNRLRGAVERTLRTAADRDISIEEYADRDRYVVRAELPGIDPARDASVSVYDGQLKIDVDRVDWHPHPGSEFRYGSFSRTVALPRRAVEETLRAAYADGVLRLTLPKHEAARPRKISVTGE